MTAEATRPTVRTLNIIVPLEVKKQLKTLAAQNDTSMTNIVLGAIETVIKQSKIK